VDASAVAATFRELGARRVVRLPSGWDFETFDLDDEWIVRVPKRPEVREWLRTEVALLPELARSLSVPVPEIAVVREDGVAYRKLRGKPIDRPIEGAAETLGRALSELHGFPVDRALELGVGDVRGERWRERHARRWDEWRSLVLPLLSSDERAAAERRERDFRSLLAKPFASALVHGDLGPEHVLCADGRITGVIDWTDVKIGDPAIDLAWPLHARGRAFAARLLGAYAPVDESFRERAGFYHLAGPFYEVAYGLEQDRPDLVATGLEGIRRRLG
jgi:aminoglycoside phosphotransferase (APT) family kinase protein